MDLLDIVLDYDCNLGCTYCTITPEMRTRGLAARIAGERIVLAARAGTTRLSLTGGDPTIRPELLGLVRHARKHGFTEVKVQTNGLVFSEEKNLTRALEAGVTRIHVSVHGYSPEAPGRYEAITRGPPGCEAMMLQALSNLVESDVHLEVDLIMMTETLGNLEAAVTDLHARGVQHFNLWYLSLTDAQIGLTEKLPPIEEVAPIVMRICEAGRAGGFSVKSFHLPRCVLPGYEDHVAHPGAGLDVEVVTPESVFQLSASRLGGGVKNEGCARCIYDPVCPGLREDYVAVHGDGVIAPVLTAPDAS